MISLVVLGIFTGIVGAVLGLGGGIVIVPTLVFIFNMPIHDAIGISLIVITANSISSSIAYLKSGEININLGIVLSIVSVLGVIVGSKVAILMSQSAVMLMLGIILIIMAYLTYMKTKRSANKSIYNQEASSFFYGEYIDKSTGTLIKYNPVRLPYNLLFSLLAGIFSGVSGTGGGSLTIPSMNIISNIPMKVATATSIFMIGFTAAAGGAIYMQAGYVDVKIVCSIVLGILFGTKLSMRYFSKITDKKVSYIIVLLLLIVAFQMIYKGLTYE